MKGKRVVWLRNASIVLLATSCGLAAVSVAYIAVNSKKKPESNKTVSVDPVVSDGQDSSKIALKVNYTGKPNPSLPNAAKTAVEEAEKATEERKPAGYRMKNPAKQKVSNVDNSSPGNIAIFAQDRSTVSSTVKAE